jgi:hypothetical protein
LKCSEELPVNIIPTRLLDSRDLELMQELGGLKACWEGDFDTYGNPVKATFHINTTHEILVAFELLIYSNGTFELTPGEVSVSSGHCEVVLEAYSRALGFIKKFHLIHKDYMTLAMRAHD